MKNTEALKSAAINLHGVLFKFQTLKLEQLKGSAVSVLLCQGELNLPNSGRNPAEENFTRNLESKTKQLFSVSLMPFLKINNKFFL